MSPISLRAALDIGLSEMGLFITAATLHLARGDTVPLWEMARIFTEQLSASRSMKSLTESVALVDALLPPNATVDLACGLVGSLAYDAVVSNLGVVDPAHPGGPARLEAVWGPMVLGRIRNERMLGAATIGGHLHLTEARPNHIPESLHQVAGVLASACSG
jgi:hypothetical protein